MIHKCNSLYKAHTTCNKKPGKRAGGSGHARDYGGWGWERDLNCAPRSSNSLSLTTRALLVLQTTKAVLETWERGSPHSRRIRTRKYSPVVVYTYQAVAIRGQPSLRIRKAIEKDARFNIAHTCVISCKYSSFTRSSFMRPTRNSLVWKRGGRRALFLRPGRIRSVRL